MKNQYFGDIRDLFKFDLIQELVVEVGINKFTYIPMLTPNDNSGEGNKRDFKKAKAGYNNRHLDIFLKASHGLAKDERDIIRIKEYFDAINIKTEIYKGGSYFTKQNRGAYFKEIDDNLLEHSLIFIDPDIGLQIGNSSDKHLLYSEIESIYKRMSKSLLMIIQFKRPIDSKEYWLKGLYKRANELFCVTGDLPVFISDGEIAFLILSRDFTAKLALSKAMLQYHCKYPKLLLGDLLVE